jgi:hypothetical protein
VANQRLLEGIQHKLTLKLLMRLSITKARKIKWLMPYPGNSKKTTKKRTKNRPYTAINKH